MRHTVPSHMTAIDITQPGGPEVLQAASHATPQPGPRELLIQVHAAGVNGPDLLQRKGLYDPPAGAPDIPGLEIAGKVVALGAQVKGFALGDAVIALVQGGGYAEYAVADERTTAHLPDNLSMVEGAALPETFMTVWVNLFQRGAFKAGETVLIHGGASGIGTTATQLAKALGAAQLFTTVNGPGQQAASLELGADVAIDYNREDFVEQVLLHTAGRGVDVIVDIIAGDYVARNFKAAAMDGRIVQIGVIKGPATELDLFPMLTKRLTHIGSTLRARSADDKAAILADLQAKAWPHVRSGAVKPLIHATFPLAAASQAHALMESGRHVGKVVLSVAHQG
nr:NAD(P)H-quinone oxidoreductase [Pseudomonas xantholysinigenes]